MSEMVEFRSSLGGFNKKDVNAYVARITREYAEGEADLQRRIAELENKLDGALQENESLRAAAQETDRDLSGLREEATRLSAENGESREKLLSLENEKNELAARAEAAERSCREMREKWEELQNKAGLYDATSAQLGDMIMSAKKTSGEILQAAEKDAEQMRAETDDRMKEIRADAEQKADSALSAVTALLGTMAEDTFGEMMTYASEAQFTIGAMFEELKRKSAEISDRVRYISSSSHQRVLEKLDGLPVNTDKALPEGKPGEQTAKNENNGEGKA